MSERVTDALVVGGGPAGSAAAAWLSAKGYRVRLLTRPVPPAAWLAESIPGSARKLLSRIGVLGAMEDAGFVRNRGNAVAWAGRPERVERFPRELDGFHADRAGLEQVFRGFAIEHGVDVLEAGPVREVEPSELGWRARVGDTWHEGRWLLDASGRAGVLARRGLRRHERDTATLALVGSWVSAKPDDNGLTLIESYEDGWAWSVPLSATHRCVTAMVDPRRTALRRDLGLDGMLDTELAKADTLRSQLGDGRMQGSARACPASLYGASAFGVSGALLVGDAGSFIDPLSSYGVKKALASARLAAIATHTALRNPALTDTVVEYVSEREQEVYRTYRARSVSFLEEAAHAHGHPFWDVRLDAARHAAGEALALEDPTDAALVDRPAEAYVGDPAVRAAYDEIRNREAIELNPGRSLRTVDKPAVVEDRIRIEPHLATDRLPEGTRYVRNIDLRRLVELAPSHDQVPDLYEAYGAAEPRTDLGDFLAALALAVGAGFLELGDAADA